MAVYSCVPHLHHGLSKPACFFKAVLSAALAGLFPPTRFFMPYFHAGGMQAGTFNSTLNREFSPRMF
eukprot:675104-Pleurochrysis_carterae.AAC.1